MPRKAKGVAVIEGVTTGDGRAIAEGAITWADLPLPLAWLQEEQHGDLLGGAVQVGTLDSLSREGSDITFAASIDDGQADGAEVIRRLEAGTAPQGARWGVSIDPDDWEIEIVATDQEDEEGAVVVLASGRGRAALDAAVAGLRAQLLAAAGDPEPGEDGGEDGVVIMEASVDDYIERYTRLRIRGLTLCAVPAFDGAYLELDGEATEEAPADQAPVTAAAVAARPPAGWFSIPEPLPGMEGMADVYGTDISELLVEQPDGGLGVPLTIREDGLVFGHLFRFGQCHVGFPGECISPPSSASGYTSFHTGEVLCADGARVPTGPLVVGCEHAARDLGHRATVDFYAHAGLGFADVRVIDGELGGWACGALRPGVTDDQLRVLRALTPSGDWRRVNGRLDLVAALMVNTPGFGVARHALAASGLTTIPDRPSSPVAHFDEDGTQLSLVAAGGVERCPECAKRAREQAALVASGADLSEMLDLVRKVERRTRHLLPEAIAASAERVAGNGSRLPVS